MLFRSEIAAENVVSRNAAKALDREIEEAIVVALAAWSGEIDNADVPAKVDEWPERPEL